MRLTFLGGADEVGASGTLIEIAGKKLLVDAGIRILPKTRRTIGDDQLPDLNLISEAGGVDHILVTHAHTDHTGALPLIVEQYPHIPVLTTAPSMALIRVLQADAQRIMKSKQEEEGELPLFDAISVGRLLDAMQPVEPRQPIRLGDELQVTYHTSGHIVGAASLVIESAEGTLVMSGDLSLTPQRAVTKASLPNVRADALVLESTYGGKLHANRAAEEKRLIETLKRIVSGGGKALIPAFALGRAQEVLQIILAHRDQLDAPVYADGMVRAVCKTYSQFADWMPEATTKAAGDDPLFFRDRVQAVETQLQRDEIARSATPCVIVASSGMLTGGASAFYAPILAGDLRNAILLTGYQDEESPGRAIQRAIQERAEGTETTIRIANKPISVRCELGTYSLSAHADEAELVSVAESFGADDVMLVHGDPVARDSLARAIRARGKVVRLPQSGGTVELQYKRKAWGVGRKTQTAIGGSQTTVDVAALWEAVRAESGGYYTAQELARVWTGDINDANMVADAVRSDALYFAPFKGDRFQVRTPTQIEVIQYRRAMIAAFPDLQGMIAYLREEGKPRIGVIINVGADDFEAIMSSGARKTFPADALIYPIAPYTGERKQAAAAIRNLIGVARKYSDVLLSPETRSALAADGNAVDPLQLIPPESLQPPATRGVSSEAMALLAIIMRMAADGAMLQLDRTLIPGQSLTPERMEQNAARQTAIEAFPPAARMRKVGLEPASFRLILYFDYPDVAAEQYAENIDSLAEMTGWEIVVHPVTTQQALHNALIELMPPGAAIKSVSFFMEKREMHTEMGGTTGGSLDAAGLTHTFMEMTGYTLRVNPKQAAQATAPAESVNIAVSTPSDQPLMEINAAYALVRAALEPLGLMRVGLKNGQLVLTFISPQVGARHADAIADVAAQTGYAMTLHPHPDQTAILSRVNAIIRAAGWTARKNPSLRTDRGELSVALVSPAEPEQIEAVARQIEDETGYRLIVS